MSSSLSPRQPEPPAADSGLIFETRQPVPVVVVKRRRVAGLSPADEAEAAASAAEASSARNPKVFRVKAASAPVPTPLPAAAVPQADAPSPQRRRRDPLRAPVLLRHEVMAPPPPEPAVQPRSAGADYRSVCEAIERVRRELDRAGQARRIRLSLP